VSERAFFVFVVSSERHVALLKLGGRRKMNTARRFVVTHTALTVCLMATSAFAGRLELTDNPATRNALTLTYDPSNGDLSYAGHDMLITVLELKSAGNLFDPSKLDPGVARGPFDVFTSSTFFQLIAAGTEGQYFGPVLPTGLTGEVLVADIAIDGSVKPDPCGHLLCEVIPGPYLYVVPEPSSLALVCCGLFGLLIVRRT
jgi:hypothetical protein